MIQIQVIKQGGYTLKEKNSEEGGKAIFWNNDIDSKEDDDWAKKVRALMIELKKSKK